MPQNEQIEIRCKHEDCHWNLGLEYASNCARVTVDVHDCVCAGFISKEEAKKRLNVACKG
jgi:hypothetical protein